MALLLPWGCGVPEGNELLEKATGHPNIITILADDMRATDFEHMPKTQDLLVKQGLTKNKPS